MAPKLVYLVQVKELLNFTEKTACGLFSLQLSCKGGVNSKLAIDLEMKPQCTSSQKLWGGKMAPQLV